MVAGWPLGYLGRIATNSSTRKAYLQAMLRLVARYAQGGLSAGTLAKMLELSPAIGIQEPSTIAANLNIPNTNTGTGKVFTLVLPYHPALRGVERKLRTFIGHHQDILDGFLGTRVTVRIAWRNGLPPLATRLRRR